ncbi:acyltransferase family protein [Serratia marcescens]|uniref:acyltransferase family protein n=1 Tax=Serratia marcescens TaxID=615 RepID=UPI000E56DA2F|nr:acyltransferase [Serratia marcescens]AXX22154.1 acyltransferase [Serratia marcescens]AXX25013.1 acyltransferase [Serratia marcescens]RTE99091.1 acyltransferase [Serratia marcescens]RTF00502.1 acyltransferase [Serratia marcescens]RTF08371.1 acyltransferase [Serratia marcescens]
MKTTLPNKIHSLDVLRGLAALAVVFWHWQHFFYVGDSAKDVVFENQPFYNSLTILYKHGDAAVELFFCISGFIFYWLYSDLISKKEIKVKEFITNRFSRLYPLYFITFIVVLALQFLYKEHHGSYFVYQQNDLYHATLNILMIPAWGFEHGWSFNAPVWSVSIEMMLYCIFFIACSFKNRGLYLIPIFIFIGQAILLMNYKIGIGVFSFFCGGATYILACTLIRKLGSKSIFIALGYLFIVWFFIIKFDISNTLIVTGFGFSSLILFLTTSSIIPSLNAFLSRFNWIGDMSYSSYLIHFPLQITFVLCANALGYGNDIFYTPMSITIFMAILIPLSLLTHKYFEVKAQGYIRESLNSTASKSIKQG